MVFSSLEFIFIFIPIFFICYYLVPQTAKNTVLFLGSICFYAVGAMEQPYYIILLISSVVVDWVCGLLIEKYPDKKRIPLILGILYHLGWLFFFKYAGFILGGLGNIMPKINTGFSPLLPIGISFYTFQGISYIVDVYRQTVPAEKSLLRVGTYICMFEQLIAGPIVTYSQVQRKLVYREIRSSDVCKGIGAFIIGLGLKVLLANPIGKLWSDVQAIGFESISTPLAWMAIIAYSLQIYLDFFGYSLMALGLGKMLGFNLPKNFDHPYLSLTMTEFWRRWHITLGNWFRDYLYIPLGGNRCSGLVTIRNLWIVWVLTGLWHGAGYNFLLWGLILFVLIITEKVLTGKYLNRYPFLGHVYMVVLIPLTWTVFAIEDMGQLGVFFTRLFPFWGQGVWSIFRYDYLKYLRLYLPLLLIGIIFCTKLPYQLMKRVKNNFGLWGLLTVIFVACVYCMYRGFNDPFMYFRF